MDNDHGAIRFISQTEAHQAVVLILAWPPGSFEYKQVFQDPPSIDACGVRGYTSNALVERRFPKMLASPNTISSSSSIRTNPCRGRPGNSGHGWSIILSPGVRARRAFCECDLFQARNPLGTLFRDSRE